MESANERQGKAVRLPFVTRVYAMSPTARRALPKVPPKDKTCRILLGVRAFKVFLDHPCGKQRRGRTNLGHKAWE